MCRCLHFPGVIRGGHATEQPTSPRSLQARAVAEVCKGQWWKIPGEGAWGGGYWREVSSA